MYFYRNKKNKKTATNIRIFLSKILAQKFEKYTEINHFFWRKVVELIDLFCFYLMINYILRFFEKISEQNDLAIEKLVGKDLTINVKDYVINK